MGMKLRNSAEVPEVYIKFFNSLRHVTIALGTLHFTFLEKELVMGWFLIFNHKMRLIIFDIGLIRFFLIRSYGYQSICSTVSRLNFHLMVKSSS